MNVALINATNKIAEIQKIIYRKRSERIELISAIQYIHSAVLHVIATTKIVSADQLKNGVRNFMPIFLKKLKDLNTIALQAQLKKTADEFKQFALERVDNAQSKQLEELSSKLILIQSFESTLQSLMKQYDQISAQKLKKAKALVAEDIKKSVYIFVMHK